MNHCLGEKNIHILEKKEKSNLVIPIEKINKYAIDWSKEKNTVIVAKLQVQKSAQY